RGPLLLHTVAGLPRRYGHGGRQVGRVARRGPRQGRRGGDLRRSDRGGRSRVDHARARGPRRPQEGDRLRTVLGLRRPTRAVSRRALKVRLSRRAVYSSRVITWTPKSFGPPGGPPETPVAMNVVKCPRT